MDAPPARDGRMRAGTAIAWQCLPMRIFLWLVLFAVGCGTPIDAISRVEPRSGGGAIVTGVHGAYDGLGEHEHTYLVTIQINSKGDVVDRDDQGEVNTEPPAGHFGGLDFGDGTRLDLVPTPTDPLHPVYPTPPQVVRRVDAQDQELWRLELPIDRVDDYCPDADTSVILGGSPAQKADGYIRGAGVVKVTRDGALAWTILLH